MVARVSSPRLVGRREELLVLEQAIAHARGGAGSVILVGGEAGIGKSRLIGELAGRAARDGVVVLVGECLPLSDVELPYAPILAALRALPEEHGLAAIEAPFSAPADAVMAGASVDRDSGVSPLAIEATQRAVFDGLLARLQSVAQSQTLLLILEDFQWADRSTRNFVSFLVRMARRERIALVISYRSEAVDRGHPLRSFVLELERSGRATRLELARFTRAELRAQVAAILDASPPGSLVDRLLERSEGNPFFTEELLAWSQNATAPLPESFRDMLLARIDEYPSGVREVLQVAAVSGRTVDHALLEALSDLSEEALDRALRAAVEGHLLTHDPEADGYAFRHALLREAIYADLLPGERRKRHLALARVLSSDPAPAGAAEPAELAHHWRAAGELPAALEESLRAAAAAEAVYAMGEAWLHYERALEIWDRAAGVVQRLPLPRLQVMRRAGEAALLTGEAQRAVELAREVISEIDEREEPVSAALAHERLGRYMWNAGFDHDAVPEYRRAVELIPPAPASEQRALVLAAEGQVLMLVDRVAESTIRCQEALAVARSVGAEAVEAHVLNTLCANLSARGDVEGAVAAAAEAGRVARRLGLIEQLFRSYINGSDALNQAGRVAQSLAFAREGLAAAREFGADGNWGNFLRAEMAERLLHVGQWEEAERLVEEVIDGSPAGTTGADAWMRIGHLWAMRGQFDQARAALDQANEQIPNSSASQWLGPVTAARAECELWAGCPEVAAGVVGDCLARLGARELVSFTADVYQLGIQACADIAAGAVPDERDVSGQQAVARQLLARLDQLRADSGATSPIVAASRATAAAEFSRVGGLGNAGLWAAAQAAWDACENPFRAAYTRWRRADALLNAGTNRSVAAALVREAHAIAAQLRARPLREATERLAQRARVDVHDADQPPRPTNHLIQQLEVTPRELEVLTLLAGGLTNREIAGQLFISDKTASVHVSRILRKLNVPNRTAAAALAHELGLSRGESPAGTD